MSFIDNLFMCSSTITQKSDACVGGKQTYKPPALDTCPKYVL